MKTQNRPLTQEELDLAPEWATHYWVDDDGDVCFENDKRYRWISNGVFIDSGEYPERKSPTAINSFNIESVEWSDSRLETNSVNHKTGETLSIYMPDIYSTVDAHEVEFELNKDDAIAIAKALGVTPEDLK